MGVWPATTYKAEGAEAERLLARQRAEEDGLFDNFEERVSLATDALEDDLRAEGYEPECATFHVEVVVTLRDPKTVRTGR